MKAVLLFIFAFFVSYTAYSFWMFIANAIIKADEWELKLQKIIGIILSLLSAYFSLPYLLK
ncbi:hypothetical protein [Hippea alviniae]|uniref:hypothetical protein n=1 Tax=Hippea alviniae TaxID=1279027 RepID=UPI0003B3530F|nr:hypothetical protein [Hippea alviniae]